MASDGGGGIKYLARLRLAMLDGQESVEGAGCFLDLAGFDLGTEVATEKWGEDGVGGCCLGFEERERRMEKERSRSKPVRLTGGSWDGIGGIGMCAYFVDLGLSGLEISTTVVER